MISSNYSDISGWSNLKTVKTIQQPEHFDPELKKLALSTVLLALLIGVGYIL